MFLTPLQGRTGIIIQASKPHSQQTTYYKCLVKMFFFLLPFIVISMTYLLLLVKKLPGHRECFCWPFQAYLDKASNLFFFCLSVSLLHVTPHCFSTCDHTHSSSSFSVSIYLTLCCYRISSLTATFIVPHVVTGGRLA